MINLPKAIRSFRYAAAGVHWFFRYENNARIHLVFAVLAIGLGLFFRLSRDEWLWALTAITAVWLAELFNTAIEKMVDLAEPNQNELAGRVKDLAAGAVLMSALYALAVGALVFVPHAIR